MLTVLFATHNRAELLSEVLKSYCILEVPPGGWKLVIVDNGSKDRTREVICSYESKLKVEYIYEPEPGKNAALNTGLEKVAGDLVLLTDDDAFPRADWLVKMRAAADEHASFSVFSGMVLPKWQVPPAAWILSLVPLEPVFTITNARESEGPTTSGNVFGPNMAVRAELFNRGFRFDPNIGPSGSSYPMGSETEFVERLIGKGFTPWYCPNAVVEHFIPQSHMHISWILSRAVRFGRGQYRLGVGKETRVLPSWRGIPRCLVRQILVEQVNILAAFLRFNQKKLFRARWQFNFLLGQAIEAHALGAERRKNALRADCQRLNTKS